MVLKFGRNEEYVVNHVGRIFFRAQEYYDLDAGENFFRISFVYLLELVEIPEAKWPAFLNHLPKPVKNTAMTLYDSILKKGEDKGIQKGIQKGHENTLRIIQLLKEGWSPEEVAKELDVDVSFVKQIWDSLNN